LAVPNQTSSFAGGYWLARTAWQQQRDTAGARIKWMFTTDKARDKMGRA
jgi:hypothetical protein